MGHWGPPTQAQAVRRNNLCEVRTASPPNRDLSPKINLSPQSLADEISAEDRKCVSINGQRVLLCSAWFAFLLVFFTHFLSFFLPRCLQVGAVCRVQHPGCCWSHDEASACTAKCCTLGFGQRLKCSVEDIWGRLPGAFAPEFD